MLKQHRSRVLVIGVDGGSWNIMKPLMDEGELPTFSKLVDEGTSGNLESTVPCNSGPAWVSFMSGKNPGKHGIFGFFGRRNYYSITTINSTYIKSRTLWTLLSNANKKLGLVNIPMTYPPFQINGLMITGVLTPSLKGRFTYPPTLGGEFLQKVKDYRIEPVTLSDDLEETKILLAQDVFSTAEKRYEASKYLMERMNDWDFFMCVFRELDAIQHYFMHTLDISHPNCNPGELRRFSRVIPDYYNLIDSIIGRFMNTLEGDCTVLVVSDHGFGSVHRSFNVVRWLEEEGYIKSRRSTSDQIRKLNSVLSFFGISPLARKIFAKLSPDYSSLVTPLGFLFNLMLSRDIEWSKTKVYFEANEGLRINLKGREPKGFVKPEDYEILRDELIAKLLEFREPETGEPVVEKVYRREEIYSGPYVGEAPDLVMSWKEYPDQRRTHFPYLGSHSQGLFRLNRTITGSHTQNGIFIAYGKNIKKGKIIRNAEIIDLAPTILYIMGQVIPQDMDGEVLTEMFEDDYVQTQRPQYSAEKTRYEKKAEEVGGKEAEIIKKRLKGLGYID